MSDERETARTIWAPRGARVLEIEWGDGVTQALGHRLLRGFCPCAQCQGHQGPIAWVEATSSLPAEALELRELREVGHYALQLGWGDGHASGIFAFRFLRALGELDADDAEALRAARFGR